jgi:cephalosporin hydroxylase
LIGLAVALNFFGLLLAIRAALLMNAERVKLPAAPSVSLHGVGLGCALVGGLVLMAAGQYQALELLRTPPGALEPDDVHPLVKFGVICGVVLAALGLFLERIPRPVPVDAPVAVGRPRGGIVVAALLGIVLLAGLNLYQYSRTDHEIDETKRKALSRGDTSVINTSMLKADEQLVRAYARRFHDEVFAKSENTPQWMGIPTQQNPNDAWLVQELIHAVKPDFIVETGTFHGGSALMWAMVLREVNPKGRVLTVDIEDVSVEARKQDIWKERIDFFLGSSTDPKIVADITNRVKGGKVLVILDALHTADHVHRELQMYSPLVDVGSYIMVQDTYFDHPPAFHEGYGPGPWTGLERFMKETDAFVIDQSRERFLFTFNPKSMLKRVK